MVKLNFEHTKQKCDFKKMLLTLEMSKKTPEYSKQTTKRTRTFSKCDRMSQLKLERQFQTFKIKLRP